MELSFTVNTAEFKKGIDLTRDRFDQAMAVSKNMVASMMLSRVSADITGAGNFGSEYLSGLSVKVEDDTVVTRLDAPGASVFESGGTISGRPLLWLPISGTDAEGIRASDYGDQLFSVNRKTGGPPLLFSIKDRAPKYFGVSSVTIPKKFHIAEIQEEVMGQFKEIFEGALNG